MTDRVDRKSGGRCSRGWIVAAGLLVVCAAAGCSRKFWRRHADNEVYTIVEEAATDPRWPLDNYTVEPDPRSRFFDPFSRDLPPMPPDDPTSHKYMHWVDHKRGWPYWDCYGQTPHVESPLWRDCLPRDDNGTVVLDKDAAVQLALIHSRDYQWELEELYLSALDVTYERFRFLCQFYGGQSTFFTADGRERGGGESQSILDLKINPPATQATMRRHLATGGELLVGMANSLVWQFAGPDDYSGVTLLDFSLVQPLLRLGGRAYAMQWLTDAERTLLANIRQMERFRRGFYAEIVAGINPGRSLSRGGMGLTSTGMSSTPGPGGFLALLERQVRIGNQRANVVALKSSYEQLEATFMAGRLESRYQVDLARQAFFDAQTTLLRIMVDYQNQLGVYKITMGLPPDLDVRIEDPLLERFNLIAPALTATGEKIAALLGQLRDPDHPVPADLLETVSAVRRECLAHLDTVEQDVKVLNDAVPMRRANLRRLSTREEFKRGDADPMLYDMEAFDKRVAMVNEEFPALVEKLKTLLAELDSFRLDTSSSELRTAVPSEAEVSQKAHEAILGQTASDAELARKADEAVAAQNARNGGDTPDDKEAADTPRRRLLNMVAQLSGRVMQLSLVQARARLDGVTLVPIDLDSQQAFEIASQHRRDWMNARAELVTTWRQVEVTANDLQSGVDLTFSGNLDTTDENPIRFRNTTGRLRVGVEFDAPLTRIAERNVYRNALITYQRARRSFYLFRDHINQSLRVMLRTVRLNQLNFEVRRAAVFVAITQVDLAQLALEKPPKPGEGSKVNPTAARDLVQALTTLLRERDDFLGVWVEYEVLRLALDFHLGTMELDDRGMWIDPGPVDGAALRQTGDAEPLAPLPEDLPAMEFLPAPEPVQ